MLSHPRFFSLQIANHRFDNWRATEPHRGQIRGLPSLGECVVHATDGVHIAVITSAYPDRFFVASVDNFTGVVESLGAAAKRAASPRICFQRTRKSAPAIKIDLDDLIYG